MTTMSVKFSEDLAGYIMYWLHWIMVTFGMGWRSAIDFWTKVNPSTGMTPAATVKYLEETQDPREREAEAKSQAAGQAAYEHYQPEAERQRRREKAYMGVVAEQQEAYDKLSETEKKEVMRQQDELEQRNQFKSNEAARIYDDRMMTHETSEQLAPKPEPVAPAATVTPATDQSAYDQYEARRY